MMKIVDNTIRQDLGIRPGPKDVQQAKSSPKLQEGKGSPEDQSDKVMLSEIAVKMRHAMETIHELPDIREDRVSSIQNRLQNGTYPVDSERLAAKILDEALSNELLGK